jgi:3-oxoacyl-[acyl-carrier-protein] synthase II
MRRVVITGVGAVSPCGADAETSFRNVIAGQSGIDRIQGFDCTDYPSQIAGECRDFKAEDYIEKKRLREMARFIHLAIAASDQAVKSARFEPTAEQKDRVGTFIGVGFCGLETFEATHKTLLEKGPGRVSPYFIPQTISNLAPGQVSMRFGLRGPSYTNTSACSSGAHSIGEAFKWIQRGGIDAALAGGAEAAVAPTGVAGFCAMRALSKRNDEPKRASRPFDKGRDGFVMGEGAGILLLEEREYAIKRGANILAEIVGYGTTADAYHLTQPAPGGEGAARAMRLALEDGGLAITDVDYVNAHGTSTPTGDMQELTAIRTVFGDHATKGMLISSTKSMTGHLLGAAGGLEAVFSVQALASGMVPPTINLEDPEEGCEGLDLVPNVAREKAIRVAISNSFGFGGTNVTLAFRRHEA